MTRPFSSLLRALCLSVVLTAPMMAVPHSAAAQAGSPFEAVLRINDSVITRYELEQRKLFLKLLRVPGDPEAEAMKGLTQDRLAVAEAKRFNLRLTAEQTAAGMEEFAGRANLSTDEFVQALAQAGVERETFRDFASNGILWRELVRGRFVGSFTISDAEIDRAITSGTVNTAMQLLLSEIILPVEGDPEAQQALARQLRAEISTEDGFAAAARRYSASPSAGRGGRLDWTPTSELPPQIVELVLALGPGQVSEPVTLPNAVAVFQLRDVTEDRTAEAPAVQLEYAQFLLPNTPDVQAQAAALHARIDTCADLYAEARGLPADRLTVETQPVAAVPADVALLLAQLDPGEYSTALTRGGARVFLMLCSRAPVVEGAINREAIREQLISRRLTMLAEAYLEELRSEAIITTP
ncbi:peptidylprolyl isomerase [Pseudotabrizicola sediminis]|uniref:Parvulin-like PPIase n=1 Tax=Pseudotabrizicola sediminis TaxID=2486418 RepID=A0ABY2KRE2_9RHOB|nr:peptidylprolyl isomerase [Pseudotabrizicola sediminis]TGD45246.1 peptidylprolyl isomerase [Pseudotabrizicola sediminis]